MIGRTLTHYRITEKIGEGGMGVVYKAEDTKLGRTIALKFVRPDLLDDPRHKERFVREAQASAALDHPNICTIHEIDEADGETFLAMHSSMATASNGKSPRDRSSSRKARFFLRRDFELRHSSRQRRGHHNRAGRTLHGRTGVVSEPSGFRATR